LQQIQLATVSSALATSIGNSNTNIAAVSVLTSVNKADIATNVAAITSINTILGDGSNFATSAELATVSSALATSIANHLPLAGGTITGTVSAQSVYVSALGANTTATLGKRIRMDGAAVADIVSLTDGANIAVDFNTGQNFAVQLAGNRTIDNPTNNYKFPGGTAPTLSTGASACDRIDYITFTSSNVHAVATLNVSTA
jgi:hypothetical protein